MSASDRTPVVILGAGLAGLSCARHLVDREYRLLEREERVGGLAVTDRVGGFLFDRAGHWLHLRDERARSLVHEVLGDGLLTVDRQASVLSHGVLTPYPFQANTYGLPPQVIRDCLLGFVEAWERRRKGAVQPANFEDFIHHHLGWGIARHFMVPYNRKLWGVPLRELSSSWCGRFVPRPSLEEVVAGAVGCPVEGLGYNSHFLYPAAGGIGTLAEKLAATLPRPAELGVAVQAIDLQRRLVVTAAGERIPFVRLVSSIPLPRLVDLLVQAPDEVREARRRLRATTVACINLGVRGPALFGLHWVYVPSPELPFYRVGSYANAVPGLAPEGCTSLYVEVSLPQGPDGQGHAPLLQAVRQGLAATGILPRGSEVLVEDLRILDGAYVLFDQERDRAVNLLQQYLRREGVYCIGRHGRWIYGSMEDSLLDGIETAFLLSTL